MRKFKGYLFILILAFSVNGYVCCLPTIHNHSDRHQSCCSEKQSPCCIKKTSRAGQVAGDNDNTLRSVILSANATSEPIEFPYIHYEFKKASSNGPELASKFHDLVCSRIFISRKDFV